MGLEGVEAIGHKDHQVPARPQHAVGLADCRPVVADVFQHLVGKDHVKEIVGIRQRFGGAHLDALQGLPGLGHPLGVDIHAIDLVTKIVEAAHEQAQATAGIEDAGILQRHDGPHQVEPPLLALTPDVTGCPA